MCASIFFLHTKQNIFIHSIDGNVKIGWILYWLLPFWMFIFVMLKIRQNYIETFFALYIHWNHSWFEDGRWFHRQEVSCAL